MECKAGREGPHGPQCLEGVPLPQRTFYPFQASSFYRPSCPFRLLEMHRLGRVRRVIGEDDVSPAMLRVCQALVDFWDNGTPMNYHEHVLPLKIAMTCFHDTFWSFMCALVQMRPSLASPLMRTFLIVPQRGAMPVFEIVPEDFHLALLREAHDYHPYRPWKQEDFGELTDEMQRHLLPFFVAGPVQREFQAVRSSLSGQLDRDTGRIARQFVSVGHTVLEDEAECRGERPQN